MKYYADAECLIDPSTALHTLAREIERASDQRDEASMPGTRLEWAREHLIAAGMIEQVMADADPGAEHGAAEPRDSPLVQVTDWCANRLAAAWRAAEWPLPPRALLRATQERLAHVGSLHGAWPEGYLFYGLFPDHYLWAGQRLAASVRGGLAVVVGVRGIGTSLSAAVSAGLRGAGVQATRCTVRPVGDPFDRLVTPDESVTRLWRDASGRGAEFLVVDEGPGLSGSSLAATVTALERHGVEPNTIQIVCAAPGKMPMATDATRAIWARTHWWVAEEHGERFWRRTIPELLSQEIGITLTWLDDLSWGNWAKHRPDLDSATPPASLPHLERRKLLLHADGGPLLAKFVGFGEPGRRKAALARHLAEAGMTPAYRGYAHGFVLHDWIDDAASLTIDDARAETLAAVGRYYAHLRRQCQGGTVADLPAVAGIATEIAATWLGGPISLEPYLRRALRGGAMAMRGDQRPERVEWLRRGNTVLKCDAADHFLDHTWAREQDVCFDLAGFVHEFGLTEHQRAGLLAAYRQASGDEGVAARLPLFRVVYAAHRLAALDTAYHAAAPEDRECLDRVRQRIGAALTVAVRSEDAFQCAC